MIGRQFTWANHLPAPSYEKLDRVLMDTEWEDKYTMVSVRALERIEKLSDHDPILLTTITPRPLCKRQFKFELGWLHRNGFFYMVKNVWERPVVGNSPIARWNNKMRAMRKHLSDWDAHISDILKKEDARLSSITDYLDALVELKPLSPQKIEIKSQSDAHIADLLGEEELK
jgi:hypothetical protein